LWLRDLQEAILKQFATRPLVFNFVMDLVVAFPNPPNYWNNLSVEEIESMENPKALDGLANIPFGNHITEEVRPIDSCS
jgi:hypothetical protein